MSHILLKFLVYGNLGVLVEFWFTGVHSAFVDKDKRAPCRSSLWMLLVYGLTGLGLAQLHDRLVWSHPMGVLLNAALYTPLIFVIEFVSGWVLRRLLGRAPWDYSLAKYGIMGLIRLDYAPFWFGLALFFDLLCGFVDRGLRYAVSAVSG